MLLGLSDEEAKACAYALSFYTGDGSDQCSRGASVICRKVGSLNLKCLTGLKVNGKQADQEATGKARPVLSFLVKALTFIPFYWGPCVRGVQMTKEEQQSYNVGNIGKVCARYWLIR